MNGSMLLVKHLPDRLHLILSTRADPPLPLSQLRSHKHLLEVRTNQLRCTAEETRDILKVVMGIQVPDETIQQITTRTEGWLVGLQLLGLSLPKHANPVTLLEQTSGDQRYILDYLTEEALRRQPQHVQTFLLSTCILERLNASLCDTVLQQVDSQQILQHLEQANVLVVSLDSKRGWYRYHTLFAETLRYRLEQMHADLIPILHHRASCWYAQHDLTTQAILHALYAQEWQWAADLIERKSIPLMSQAWGVSYHTLAFLQQWVRQLPAEVMHARPLLCYASSVLLFQVAPVSTAYGWLDAAGAILTTALDPQTHADALPTMLPSQMQQEQQDLFGAMLGLRAILRTLEGDGWSALAICEQALTLTDNVIPRSQIVATQALAWYISAANDAVAAVQSAFQAVSLAQDSGIAALALNTIGAAITYTVGTGQLHEAQCLTQQAI